MSTSPPHDSKLTSNASSSSSLADSVSTTASSSKWGFARGLFGGSGRGAGEPSTKNPPFAVNSDPVEDILGRFWFEVSTFAFDKGKEVADKGMKSCGGSGMSPWLTVLGYLGHISEIEKSYLNLSFLAPKGFLRKESNLKSMLDGVKSVVKKVGGSSSNVPNSKHSLSKVAAALTLYVNLRLEMIEFYEKLSLYGTAKNIEISDLVTDLDTILEKFSNEKKANEGALCLLDGIHTSLNWESQAVFNALKAINSMQTWSYLDSTVAIQLLSSNLQEWSDRVHSNSTTVKKSSFYASAPTSPLLFLWVRKLKAMLLSKYTLYFYELLCQHSSQKYDINQYCTKLSVDYYGRILGFQKKTDALCICIVFDARGTSFYRNGYRFPRRSIQPVEGLDSYPSILSVPGKPVQHWPSVVMLINDRLNELNAGKTVAFFDPGVQVQMTYFVQQIDVRMFLLCMYETKKSEKDAYILKFLVDLAEDLKGVKMFTHLKHFKV